jgi:hypothetical protein
LFGELEERSKCKTAREKHVSKIKEEEILGEIIEIIEYS